MDSKNKQNIFFISENITSPKIKSKTLLNRVTQLYVNPTLQDKRGSSRKDDLFRCMRVFLRFGRIIGVVPLSGVFGTSNLDSVSFSRKNLAGITTLLIILLMTLIEALSIYSFFITPARDAKEIAKNAQGFVCYGIGLYIIIYMYRNCTKMLNCFHKWRTVQTVFQREDDHLFRDITLISGIIFTSAILENLTSHWKHFKSAFISVPPPKQPQSFNNLPFGGKKVYSSVWEDYYAQSPISNADGIPYHISLSIILFFCNKWAVYAWNFGDILISAVARAMYNRFKFNFEDFKEKLSLFPGSVHDESMWLQAVKDHTLLVDLMETFASLLSPLLFSLISTNIYFICVVLNSFLVPAEQDVVNNVYEAWAFIHLLVRTYITIFSCAKINEYAHKLEELLILCPVDVYSKEIERSLLVMRTSSVGFGGLKCFVITKPFILSVFSVIFTFEIVLLQSVTQPPSTST